MGKNKKQQRAEHRRRQLVASGEGVIEGRRGLACGVGLWEGGWNIETGKGLSAAEARDPVTAGRGSSVAGVAGGIKGVR